MFLDWDFISLFFIPCIFPIFSNVSICIPYILGFFSLSACSYLVEFLFLVAILSSITLLGNAGWNGCFHFSFSPSWLFPAVPFIFVRFSFMPSICLICVLVLFLFLFFTAAQSHGWSFICLIFILDACTNHWSVHFWIPHLSSRFSFIVLWRYLSFGQLWKSLFLRLFSAYLS